MRLFCTNRWYLGTILAGCMSASVVNADNSLIANTMVQIGEARLELAEQVLFTTSARMEVLEDLNSRDGHYLLAEIAEGHASFRSILAVDADGVLSFDSYNRFRFTSPDLSQRRYFIDGILENAGKAQMHNPVMGKQSGLPFIPISMKVGADTPADERLLVLTFDPQSLLPKTDWCAVCGAVVILNGDVIAATSMLSDANHDIAARLAFDGDYGQQTISIRGLKIDVDWRKSTKFGLVFAVYDANGGAHE